jgi:hypothetical protein
MKLNLMRNTFYEDIFFYSKGYQHAKNSMPNPPLKIQILNHKILNRLSKSNHVI